LFITPYYPPEIGAPQNRISEFVKLLVASGTRVTVLTGMPNYPTGRVFPKYAGRLFLRETRDGATLLRSWIVPLRESNLFWRALNYLSFAISSVVCGLLRLKDVDAMVVESPPLTTAVPARVLGLLKSIPYIFNVSDLWPDSVQELGALNHPAALKILKGLEKWAYAGASALTGQSSAIVESLSQRAPAGVSAVLVRNGADLSRFPVQAPNPTIRARYGLDAHSIGVVYAGLHGHAQGLDQILAAARELMEHRRFRFLLIGDGPEKKKLMEMAGSMKLQNVTFHDPVDRDELPEILASMDIACITLGVVLTGAVPSKIYEAMACSLPVVFAGSGEGVQLIEQSSAGICSAIGDTAALVKAILRLEDDDLRTEMATAGRKAVEKNFSRQASLQVLQGLLKQVIRS
jgi:glycosyltransferase involved in cell wall biosynthesis